MNLNGHEWRGRWSLHVGCAALLFLSTLCARSGTIIVEGDQIVTGSQTIHSNQTVMGSLTVSNEAGAVALDVAGAAARLAGSRVRSLGACESDRWFRVARIGSANAVLSGRVLAEGSGADYVADFAFPSAPQSGPYRALLVEMGGATNFAWEVRSDGGSNYLWFMQPAGSRFATFLYSQHGCDEDWGSAGSPSGNPLWSDASGERGDIRAGAVTLSGAGLRLPDGTLLDARSNMTASALADGGNILLSASGGQLLFAAPARFPGEVTMPEVVSLGTNGVVLSAERWGMVDSSFANGDLVVSGNLTVSGTSTLRHIPPGGDISMGGFTNGPPLNEASLVLHLPLDGNAVDISGAGHHGSANDVTYVLGRNGHQAASFNGSTSYIDIPKNGLDDISNYDGPFTISLWLNVPDPVPGVNAGIYSFGGTNTGADQWRCYVSGYDLHVYFATDDINPIMTWPSGWHHVCVVFLNDLNRTGIVYVDGSNAYEFTGCGTVGNYDPCMRLGGILPGWASEVPFLLQDVKFFDRALGAGEVAGLAAE